MLTQIEIKNYRSCRHVVLKDLGPLTVLVGRNAAGKSNILRGIRALADAASSQFGFPIHGDEQMSVSCQALLNEGTYDYEFRAPKLVPRDSELRHETRLSESLRYRRGYGGTSPVFERLGEEVRISNGNGQTLMNIGGSTPCMAALLALLPDDSETARVIRPFVRFLEGIRYYDLARAGRVDKQRLIRQAEYDEWLARHPRRLGTSPLMRLLHMALANEAQLSEVRSLLGTNGLGLLDEIVCYANPFTKRPRTVEGRDQWYRVAFAPTSPGQSRDDLLFFDYSDLATGTQRLIRIVVSLIHDQSAVMLLEHPEDGIHRGLLRKLIDLLQKYSDQSQLIIASHSTVVFNSIDPRAIRLVTMAEGGTSVRSLTDKELRAAKTFLEDEGTLSDFIESVEEG